MLNLRDEGVLLAIAGHTSLEEVLLATRTDEEQVFEGPLASGEQAAA